ncbi:hypothetical protein LOTGIDRAFT_210534 [Lottia gigantea]|uniref:TOG domain-containing protein n=1 Tax=Lottia gigantea TaxID=225164 RepID=V3Z8D9_LOTGI|nr:hypothetical protein LOTGIDRAFT_210534 [Lottia gigantea]ESO87153.1 hypothetical protein LOTGIDRAFT_210534 [Lottia gigantea]
MAAKDENSNTVLQGIARHINCLGEENRNTRKKALERIHKETLKRDTPLEATDLKVIFREVLPPVLKIFSDPVEKCRELSVNLISSFLKSVPEPEDHLYYIIPVLVARLGQQDIIEPSEEQRLLLIELLKQMVECSGKKMAVYLDDCVTILQRTVIDPYPEVKKESCKCAAFLARSIPEHFHMLSEALIKPLLIAIAHQHSKVRTIVVESIGDVVQYGNGKTVEPVISHLAQRLFDQAPAVRKSVIKVIGTWLLNLPDRYSFFHRLVPLLLTGITDEQPEIAELADSYWHDVGIKYERENEDDLKDKQDFAKEDPKHYPPNVERPNLGCRTLIMRHLSKILPGLMKDITDWVLETRIKSAALLYVLLLNAEEYITQHMEIVLSGSYRACMDEEPKVVHDVQRACELIGYFVSPEVWCKIVLNNLKSSQSYGSLMVTAAVIKGSERQSLKPFLPSICETLTLSDVCHSVQVGVENASVHVQLLSCVSSICTVMKGDIVEIGLPLFTLCLTVLSLSQDEQIKQSAQSSLETIAISHGMSSKQDLYNKYTVEVIQQYNDNYYTWTNHTVERQIFDTLLLESGDVMGDLLPIIIPILVTNLKPDKDPEMRLKFFTLLSKLVLNSGSTLDSRDKFSEHAVTVVKDMIMPNCTWRAGRTAGAIRTTAVSCLWALLQSKVLTKEKMEPIVEGLLTQMITTMEDDNKSTRLIACRVMTRIFGLMGGSLNQDRLHNIYPELLKRLDDSSDEIRIMVSKTFLAYFDCFDKGYDPELYKAHLEDLFRGLLVHLDDPEPKIQDALLVVLKRAGQIHPGMLKQEIESVKHKHRSVKYCEMLLQDIQVQ